jgi:hypothetical protein
MQRQPIVRTLDLFAKSPVSTAALALLTFAGVMLHWTEGWRWSRSGLSYQPGQITAIVALATAFVCGLRLFRSLSRDRYLVFGLLFGIVNLGVTLWFYADVVGDVDPVVNRWLAFWFTVPRIRAGWGLHLTLLGSIGQVATLLWQGRDSLKRAAAPRPRAHPVSG